MNRLIANILACSLLLMLHVGVATARQDSPGDQESVNTPGPSTMGDKFPLLGPTVRSDVQLAAPSNPPAALGMLAVQAVQGTPGGRAIGPVEIEIELHHRGMLYDTIKTKLDEHGVALIENLPIAMGLQPVARVFWADLSYQVTGTVLDANNPYQKLEVVCYEPTEEMPQWKVLMRHVMTADTKDGLAVTEVMVIENPADRTWIGKRDPKRGEDSKRLTTAFNLPSDAKDVALGRGFHEWCCTTHDGNSLVNHLPLVPGKTEMVFGYVIPARKGKVALDLPTPNAPGGVEHMMVLVPESVQTESFSGVELSSMDGSQQPMGREAMRYYIASNLADQQSPRLMLTGLRGGGPALASSSSESFAKIIALGGGGAVLLIALLVIFLKSKSNSTPRNESAGAKPSQAQAI